jgi:hypothetical protein
MQYIARNYGLELPTSQCLIKKRCQITENAANLKIPKEEYKYNYGINIDPIYKMDENKLLTIILQSMGDLYDASPDAFESVCEMLSTIDLNTEFSNLDNIDLNLIDDSDDLFNEFQERYKSKFDSDNGIDENEITDVDVSDENDVIMEDSDTDEYNNKENEPVTISNSKIENDILNFIRTMIKKETICMYDEVVAEFEDAANKLKLKIKSVITSAIEKDKNIVYDDRDKAFYSNEMFDGN